jgi:Flp pilus assembly protein TadD
MPLSPAAAAVLAGILLAPAAAPAAEQWIKLKSSHFELYTTASEKKGREAILYFEQVRDFFGKILVEKKGSAAAPVRLIAFRSEKEYKPFQPSEAAVAFYLAGYDRDYIVMQSIAAENYPVAVHEFIHMLVKHSGIEVPIWFNEGLAELYSTMKPVGKKVQVGDLIPGRLVVLRDSKWLPVDALTAVGHDSPYYNERDRAGVFYAESWALMHMLNLSPQYRPQFGKFLTLLASGLPATNAFWQAYAKTTVQVQQDLQQYLRGNSFNGAVFDVKLQKSDEQPDIEDAPPLESAVVLADLLALSGKKEEAKQKYDSAARQFPKNWEPEAGLAELALREKDIDGAGRHFARAAELGSTNARLYYNYAMTLRSSGQKDAALIPVLKQALDLDPDYQDAHHYLAYCMLQSQDYEGAVEHFTKVRQIKRAEAFQYYHGLAYANYRLDKRDAARKAAEAAR